MATGRGIWLPTRLMLRLRGKALHVRLSNGHTSKSHVMTVGESLRLGYGDTSEVNLGEGEGPPVVVELTRSEGTRRISTPLTPEDLGRFVELSVDGEPLRDPGRELRAGSQVDIIDKSGGRRYRMVVDPPSFLIRYPRRVTVLGVLFLVLALGYAAFLQWNLHTTAQRLREAESRLVVAESGVRRAERSASEALGRIESTQVEMVRAFEGFRTERDQADRSLQEAFDARADVIRESFREKLAEVSREDLRARGKLEAEMRGNLAGLREELSNRMVQTYQLFKAREEDIYKALATRFAAVEPESEVFKRIFRAHREMVVFIRTEYRVRFGPSGEEKDFTTFGTGFFVSPGGEVVTARHVLFPWESERQLVVLVKTGLAEVLPESGRITVWLTDRRVHNDDPANTIFYPGEGYLREGDAGSLSILYAEEPEWRDEEVATPYGMMTVSIPQPGSKDLAVIQVLDFERSFAYVKLAPLPLGVETLDEVMTLGYPFARLRKGVAAPQPSRGMVRRISPELLELDSPMHPGLSGGPILNQQGLVIGMAVGVIETPVYGMAVRGEEITRAIEAARDKVRADQRRLKAVGCDPGPIDGRIGRETWAAYQCGKNKER